MNNTYEKLVSIRLKNFIASYRNAVDLFASADHQNGLRHPGEYGGYKERLVTELFQYMLPRKYSFCSGFIVNHKGKISTHLTGECKKLLTEV